MDRPAERRAQAKLLHRDVVDTHDHDVARHVVGALIWKALVDAGRLQVVKRAGRVQPQCEHGGGDTRRDDQEDATATAIEPHRA